MTWTDLFKLVSEEAIRFAADTDNLMVAHAAKGAPVVDGTLAVEKALRANVDASVRHFARHRDWPGMPYNEAYLLKKRLIAAVYILGAMITPDLSANPEGGPPIVPDLPESFEEETQIEWILIHVWHGVAAAHWETQLRMRWGDQKIP
jgi:hypothetical protein